MGVNANNVEVEEEYDGPILFFESMASTSEKKKRLREAKRKQKEDDKIQKRLKLENEKREKKWELQLIRRQKKEAREKSKLNNHLCMECNNDEFNIKISDSSEYFEDGIFVKCADCGNEEFWGM